MDWHRVRSIVRWGGVTLAAAQAASLVGLSVVDRQRKARQREARFPTAPPTTVSLGDLGDLTVYTKGADLYEDMIQAIDAAQHTLHLETYIWKSDEIGHDFKNAVTRALDRGVNVSVVYDVFGNTVVRPSFYSFDPRINVIRHRPWTGMSAMPVRGPGLNHRKILVLDGAVAFVGGFNLGTLYATQWRDTHARVCGPAAAELENAFVDYWNQTRRPWQPPTPQPPARPWNSTTRVIRNVPSLGVYPIRYMYLEAIDRAQQRIWLTHAYLIPDSDFIFALSEAARRGVDVRIIVPAESNHIMADWVSRAFYRTLLSNGIRLFLFQGAMVHAKTGTIDGHWSTIGTANLDRASLTGNFEVNLEVLDDGLAAVMEDIFELDSTQCTELTLSAWEQRPVAAKVSELVLAPFGPLL
ncbi:MAG: phospholipase D-like domain-containing protein [Propioniciclava sp.]